MRALITIGLLSRLWCAGCTEDAPHDVALADSGATLDTALDTSSTPDMGADLGTPDTEPECYDKPTTHYQIINACTDAAKFDKKPTGLPFLPDGGLPLP